MAEAKMKSKTPLFLTCSVFLVLVLLLAGFIASKRFIFVIGNEDDYDAEVDEKSLQLSNLTSPTLWDLHKDIKTNNVFKVHFFHVQNPKEVMEEAALPKLVEKGPYTYEEIKTRVTLGIYQDSDSVRYKDHSEFYFKPHLSLGKEDEIVTIINMPWVGLAQEVSRLSSLSRFIVMAIVSRFKESVFMTKSVKDIIFGGFYHELIATLSGITGETYMPNNTFGFFYGRNGSFLDPREVSLGLRDEHSFGKTLKWKGKEALEWWSNGVHGQGKEEKEEEEDDWFNTGFEDEDKKDEKNVVNKCNQIQGSDWNLFHPNVKKNEDLIVFDDRMCRNLKLVFDRQITLAGIQGYRFVIPRSEYGDPRNNEENMCYCTSPGEGGEDCPLDGAYQLNACSKGASVLLSQPHFYDGHETYVKNAQGLKPEKDKHETYIDIEPTTGQVLRFAKRVQVNLHLRPLKNIQEFNNVPNVIFPVMWTEELGMMKDQELVELKAKLKKDKLTDLIEIEPNELGFSLGKHHQGQGPQYLIIGGGAAILVIGFVVVNLMVRRKEKIRAKSTSTKEEEGVEFITINEKNSHHSQGEGQA